MSIYYQNTNYSKSAKLTINVDTIRPNVLISSPTQDDVVGGEVKIIGGVTDTDLDEFRVEYAEGEKLTDDGLELIRRSKSIQSSR